MTQSSYPKAIEDLITKWRTEIQDYPDSVEGVFAKTAVQLCSIELEELLKNHSSPTTARNDRE